MGSLSVASLLAKSGKKVLILEQNYLAGGCTSSYWRKGFVFESGATTLVGLNQNQPLAYLLKEIDVKIDAVKLDLPMQVRLRTGKIINRYEPIEQWIKEAERIFGKKNQQKFWQKCYQLSQFVWDTSLKQTHFPIGNFSDLINCIKNVNLSQLRFVGYSLISVEYLLKKYGLFDNEDFVDFINAQLLITAQNSMKEVNMLFGAAALCYTNYANYYVNGGLINLVNPIIESVEKNGGNINFRENVLKINPIHKSKNSAENYHIETDKENYTCNYLISGIPINNTLELFPNIASKFASRIFNSSQLNSAFQMGIGFKKTKSNPTIHFQIHLQNPLPSINAQTIFVSLSHANDRSRADDPDTMVASVSTHWHDPEKNIQVTKLDLETFVVEALVKEGILEKEDILYVHSSTPVNWNKWTKRAFGFVGGYPQYMHIKPWQMLDARLDHHKAYQVGDTVYPGQGIPGVVLSGIIAYEKIKSDWE